MLHKFTIKVPHPMERDEFIDEIVATYEGSDGEDKDWVLAWSGGEQRYIGTKAQAEARAVQIADRLTSIAYEELMGGAPPAHFVDDPSPINWKAPKRKI